MAAYSNPVIVTFKADASITKGLAVKIGTDADHVAKGAANTDACVGIAMSTAEASGDLIEVALVGGGAKAKVGESVVAGKLLVSHTDGTLVKANASSDRIIAMAMQDGAASDYINVVVMVAQATAAE